MACQGALDGLVSHLADAYLVLRLCFLLPRLFLGLVYMRGDDVLRLGRRAGIHLRAELVHLLLEV